MRRNALTASEYVSDLIQMPREYGYPLMVSLFRAGLAGRCKYESQVAVDKR